MKGKYIITADNWFIAPDGQEYKAVWGEVEILQDNILGVKTNRNATNWYAKVGDENNHVIIAGCQIHYAAKSLKKPSNKSCKSWSLSADNYKEHETPTRIYFTE